MNQNNLSSDIFMEIINIQTEVVQQGIDLSSIMDLVTRRTQLITNEDGSNNLTIWLCRLIIDPKVPKSTFPIHD